MTVRAVLFDLMDTVLHDPYREALRAACGRPLQDVARFQDRACWPAFEVAAIDESEFARRFFGAGGETGDLDRPRFDLEAFHDVRRAGCCFLPGMRELLVSLRGRVERHLASNYPIWIEELRRTHELDALFEGMWVSHHLGVRKPDDAFFARVLERISHPPDHCLFVDDRAVNCEAAARAGLNVHLFGGATGVSERLRLEGVFT